MGVREVTVRCARPVTHASPTGRSRRKIADWNAHEPADADEAAPFIELVKRAISGEQIELGGRYEIGVGTKFQRAVWEGVSTIPHGQVLTYGQLAERVGYPGAARAVGQAVGSNPIPLLIPCHRVVASNGIGGYGGPVNLKRKLLAAEGVHY